MRVYLAGPINGCTDAEVHGWRDEAVRELARRGLVGINPALRDYRMIARPTPGQARRVVEPDLDEVRSCESILAYCWRESSGTTAELWRARDWNKIVVAVIPLWAPCSSWNVYPAHHVAETLVEAYDFLEARAKAAA